MTKREVFHISLPTPMHPLVVAPTLLLGLLVLVLGWPWWLILTPVAVDLVLIAIVIAAIRTIVHVHNARVDRRWRRRVGIR